MDNEKVLNFGRKCHFTARELTWCHFTVREDMTSRPLCSFTAQLVECRTGVAEVTSSNLVEALIFFRLHPSNCLNWKNYCDDHSSLSLKLAMLGVFNWFMSAHLWFQMTILVMLSRCDWFACSDLNCSPALIGQRNHFVFGLNSSIHLKIAILVEEIPRSRRALRCLFSVCSHQVAS